MKTAVLWILLLLGCTPAFARRYSVHRNPPKCRVSCYTLFPTAGSLARQNEVAASMGLRRVKNRAMLAELVGDGSLVPLPVSRALRSTVPPRRAFLRPVAAAELAELSQSFYDAFEVPLIVSSAVRPLDVQRRLWRSRRVPAAPPTGPTASVHPTGLAFDIGKKRLTAPQRFWMEWRLWYWQQTGRAIVEEERACFHIVYSPGFALSDSENGRQNSVKMAINWQML